MIVFLAVILSNLFLAPQVGLSQYSYFDNIDLGYRSNKKSFQVDAILYFAMCSCGLRA